MAHAHDIAQSGSRTSAISSLWTMSSSTPNVEPALHVNELFVDVQPCLPGFEVERPPEKVEHERCRRFRATRRENRLAVLPGDGRRERVRLVELAEKIFREISRHARRA